MSAQDLLTVQWRKSSYTGDTGGQCVEVGAFWRKSSRSDSSGGACVEVAGLAPVMAVRDSKDPEGPKLLVGARGWSAFMRDVKAGAHDLA